MIKQGIIKKKMDVEMGEVSKRMAIHRRSSRRDMQRTIPITNIQLLLMIHGQYSEYLYSP